MALMIEATLLSDKDLLLSSQDEDFDDNSEFQNWKAEVPVSMLLDDFVDTYSLTDVQPCKVHLQPSPNCVVKSMGEFDVMSEFLAPRLPTFPDLRTAKERRRPFCTFLNFRGTRLHELKRKPRPYSSVPETSEPPNRKRTRNPSSSSRADVQQAEMVISDEIPFPNVAPSLQDDEKIKEYKEKLSAMIEDLLKTRLALRDMEAVTRKGKQEARRS
jgi:hypothetical protein